MLLKHWDFVFSVPNGAHSKGARCQKTERRGTLPRPLLTWHLLCHPVLLQCFVITQDKMKSDTKSLRFQNSEILQFRA